MQWAQGCISTLSIHCSIIVYYCIWWVQNLRISLLFCYYGIHNQYSFIYLKFTSVILNGYYNQHLKVCWVGSWFFEMKFKWISLHDNPLSLKLLCLVLKVAAKYQVCNNARLTFDHLNTIHNKCVWMFNRQFKSYKHRISYCENRPTAAWIIIKTDVKETFAIGFDA